MDFIALDIETTGLDSSVDSVLAVAFASASATRVLQEPSEEDLLAATERFVGALSPHLTIVTWNGEEFDLPFLTERFARCGLESTLQLWPLNRNGKYGKPAFGAQWGTHSHVDIAPQYREVAARLGVEWSLKPVARAVLHREPVEVDRRGQAIRELGSQTLREYVASDAEITLALARARLSTVPAVG